ncbi:uncharacterized protein LOC110454045 [Mizuhopecten yessoensis]|uniref:Synaptopodin 2-like protein n=1 Tax=Mizuhopecten yessoensis TaxID=6573 RepID=A0A210QG11_MIZYE|nr:uncharacterized protein LOC110454045 [Mizuhopecten yessoensis]OWF47684.1 Synaptopodin 2-like protein [Mizuhopecten yessoensis]
MAQRLTIRMNRADSGMSWGFRLHGGMEYGLPMTVLTIVRKSVCDRCGLRPRDRVVAINNMNVDGATHEQTKMEIIRSGLELEVVVYRDPPGTALVTLAQPTQPPAPVQQANSQGYLQGYGPVLAPVSQPSSQPTAAAPAAAPAPAATPAVPEPSQVPEMPASKPEAPAPELEAPAKSTPETTPAPAQEKEPLQEPAPSEPKKESPAHTAPLSVDTSVEIPPDTEVLSPMEVLASPAFREMSTKGSKPFSPGGAKKAIPNVTHSQFNSPMGLYSADNIAAVYAAQTEGIEREMEGLDVSKAPVGTKMSGSLQVID